METQRTSDGVRQDKLAGRQRLNDDVGQVELEEVDVTPNGATRQVSHLDLWKVVSRVSLTWFELYRIAPHCTAFKRT